MKIVLFLFLMGVGLLSASIQALYVEPKTKKNPGIFNQNGNDCFLNSSMQIFTNLPGLDQLLTSPYYQEGSIPGQFIVFQNALRTFDEKSGQALGSTDVGNVKKYGSKKFRAYVVDATKNVSVQGFERGQHDAQEFLSCIIDEIAQGNGIPDELKKSFKEMFCFYKEGVLECSVCHSSSMKKIDEEWLLSLPIPYSFDSEMSFDLFDLMDAYLAPENFEEYECERCNKRYVYKKDQKNYNWMCAICRCGICNTQKEFSIDLDKTEHVEVICNHDVLGDCPHVKSEKKSKPTVYYFSQTPIVQKKFSIRYLPKIITLCPKRFLYSDLEDRIDNPISCPEKKILVDEAGGTFFHLVGRVNHTGGTGGGHYTAYVRDLLDKQWYLYDDSICSSVETSEVTKASEDGYIFFYVREDIFNAGYIPPVNEAAAVLPKPITWGIDGGLAKKLSTLQVSTDEKKEILEELLFDSPAGNPTTKEGKTVFDLFVDFVVGVAPYRGMIQNFDHDEFEDLPEETKEEFFGGDNFWYIETNDIEPTSYFEYFKYIVDRFALSDELKEKFKANHALKVLLDQNEEGFKFDNLCAILESSKITPPPEPKDPLMQKLQSLRTSLQGLRNKLDALRKQLSILKKKL